MTKEEIHELVDHLPEGFSSKDLIDKILLLQKIEIAQEEIENGEGTDWEEVKKEMDSWLK